MKGMSHTMIIWLSGPYGVGKSTLAEAMAAKMENALIFDAEEVGNAVRENYPNCPYGYIFEDYPLWGEFCYLLLKDVHEKFHKDILVPMTLVRAESCRMIENLLRDGIDTRLIVLEASYQTVHDRILARGEEEGAGVWKTLNWPELAPPLCRESISGRMAKPWTNCVTRFWSKPTANGINTKIGV